MCREQVRGLIVGCIIQNTSLSVEGGIDDVYIASVHPLSCEFDGFAEAGGLV